LTFLEGGELMVELRAKVALITGAAGNLGEATARLFSTQGASLALVDREPDRLATVFDDLQTDANHLLVPDVDLTDETAAHRAIDLTVSHFGRVDALVNTVGAYHGGSRVHEDSLGTSERIMAVNLRTAFLVCRAVLPQMVEQRDGRIVNIGSRNALKGAPGAWAYSAAKSAVVRLTESLASEVNDFGITANCVLPGTIDTPENRQAMPDADHERFVPPEAIAHLISFLCSEEAWAISGAAIPIYGRS
jgi:NAD(P)-dependent dehydrogenase (short-subunit alcohol dehydrogenase family)